MSETTRDGTPGSSASRGQQMHAADSTPSPATDTPGNIEALQHVAVRAPPFWKECPQAWFIQLESVFACQQIVSDHQRYNTLVSSLSSEVVQDLLDVLLTPPETGKYANLRQNILARYGETAQQRLHKLLTGLELGSRTPSQLLRHMRTLAGGSVDDEALRVKWLDLLPDNVAKMLRILCNNPLEELAEVADGIMDSGPATFAVEPANIRRAPSPARNDSSANACATAELAAIRQTLSQLSVTCGRILEGVDSLQRSQNTANSRSRSRSRESNPASSGGVCYYHQRFGDQATNCTPPCSHRLARGN